MKKKILSMIVLLLVLSFAFVVPVQAFSQCNSSFMEYGNGTWVQTIQMDGTTCFQLGVSSENYVYFTVQYDNATYGGSYTTGGGYSNVQYLYIHFSMPPTKPLTIYFQGTTGYVSYTLYDSSIPTNLQYNEASTNVFNYD